MATAFGGAKPYSHEELRLRTIERRAVEAVIWGLPAVNFELLCDGLVAAKGDWNEIVYWSRLPGWKNQTLTPNPDVIYLFPFYDTRNGPVVLEIPPAEGGSITGTVDDGWQTPLDDVGPAGRDKGQGGKYLILPPGHGDRAPAGYIPLPSSIYAGYGVLRSNIRSGSQADVAKAVAYGKNIKIYPLSQASSPPATRFVDAIDVVYDSTISYDLRFFEKLHRFVQREPWLERDKAMIDRLKSIGIEKGKPLSPDAKTQEVLKSAIAEAHAWVEAQYETSTFAAPFFSSSRWAMPASREAIEGLQTNFATPDAYPVDERGVMYSFAFFSAKRLGEGQYYLMTIKDKAGQAFDGASTYRLTVPPKAPVKLYWSATAYDRATHALIREQQWSSRASTTEGLEKNADGSVDVYFGSKAPAGKESNWIPTRAGGQFEVLFRLYGPDQAFFDRKWVLPDVERIV